VAFNVTLSNQKQDKASMLALANVEALADDEVSPTPLSKDSTKIGDWVYTYGKPKECVGRGSAC